MKQVLKTKPQTKLRKPRLYSFDEVEELIAQRQSLLHTLYNALLFLIGLFLVLLWRLR